jgi:hypothetical protein
LSGGEINPTELIATLINQEATFEDGIERALSAVEGETGDATLFPASGSLNGSGRQ